MPASPTLRDRIEALFQRSAVLSLIRIGGAGIGFFAHLMLAWILPPEQLGVFYSATSLAAVAGIVTAQGYPQIAARFAVRYGIGAKTGFFRIFVGQVLSDGLRMALLVAGAIVAGAWLYPGLDPTARWTFSICGAMLPAITFLNIETNLAGALKRFGLCYIPEGLFRPAAFFLFMAIVTLLGFSQNSAGIAAVFALITFGVAMFVHVMLMRVVPRWSFQPVRGSRVVRRWRREALPLILLSLFTNFFVDVAIICVTPVLSSADVAVFGLCLKLAMLVGYIVQIAQQMAVPDLAAARRDHRPQDVGRILRRAIVVPSVATLIAAAAVAVGGKQMLSLFGPAFAAGQMALLILVMSQFVRALAGPSAHMITLTGSQDLNAGLCAGAIVLLLASYGILVPSFGLTGAALAVFITFCVWLATMAAALRWLGEYRTDGFALLGSFRKNTTVYAASNRATPHQAAL
jgi:O-antigen/teichoic acid export membrane protein